MAVDPDTFKKTLASFASGVTVVTSQHGDLRHGMTVSAFASVSLEPPLILICAEKASNTLGVIQKSAAFQVSILASAQDELSDLFASKSREALRFDGLECALGVTGCPRIPGALAYLDCRVEHEIDAGDHVVYIGAVEAAAARVADPLVYFRAGYRKLA